MLIELRLTKIKFNRNRLENKFRSLYKIISSIIINNTRIK